MGGITIIIPVYNTNLLLLQECIDSIKQSNLTELEILLIDDGSSPKYKAELKKISGLDSRVSIHFLNHGGVSKTRNYGITIAKYKYISFVDSDDLINSDYLEQCIMIMEKNHFDLLIGKLTQDKERIKNIKKISFSALKKDELINSFDYIFNSSRVGKEGTNSFITREPVAKIYSKNFLLKNNIFFNSELSIGEDLLFVANVIKFFPTTAIIDNEIYYYRSNPESSTCSFSKNRIDKILKTINAIDKFKIENNEIVNQESVDWCIYGMVRDCFPGYFIHPNKNISLEEQKIAWKKLVDNNVIKTCFSNLKNSNNLSLKHKLIVNLVLRRNLFFLKQLFYLERIKTSIYK